MLSAALAVLLTILIAFVFLIRWREQKGLIVHDAAIHAFRDGRLDEAEAGFRRAMKLNYSLRSIARFNLASIGVRRGYFEDALAVYLRLRWFAKDPMRTQLLLERARCLAILGRLDDCDRLLEKASRRGGELWASRATVPVATVRCRQQRFREAIDVLDEGWAECAREFAPGQMVWPVALKAFSLDALGADPHSVATVLGQAEPEDMQEIAAAATHWPELASFLGARR